VLYEVVLLDSDIGRTVVAVGELLHLLLEKAVLLVLRAGHLCQALP